MWTVYRISESDFGCEERGPNEPLTVIVDLECDDGRRYQLEVPDRWLTLQEIDEGDEWPYDIEEEDADTISANKQMDWMNNYYDALEELEDS